MPSPWTSPSQSEGVLTKIIAGFSVVTMLATIPQVVSAWTAPAVSGVSLISWVAYTIGAGLWFVHGIQKRDPSIYVACIGWIILDAAVVIGVLLRAR